MAVAGQVTVTVAEPVDFHVTVAVPLLIDTVATPVAFDDTVGVAPLLQLAVNVPVVVG